MDGELREEDVTGPQEHEQGSQRDRGTEMRLTERIRKLIPETW